MVDESDWRWSNGGEYLVGLTFYQRRWTMTRPEWDHDHCELCFAKFMAEDAVDAEILHDGYATEDQYRWLCEQCFADFRDHFRWSIGT
jgi:hypothetical protein